MKKIIKGIKGILENYRGMSINKSIKVSIVEDICTLLLKYTKKRKYKIKVKADPEDDSKWLIDIK